ncbi:MAG TPA: DivIVA domain-containing protein, partial [Thermoleophilaceae bacterium]|nr:DivIVA domain-containing protein [Thermoleophilaceae bacterium]
GHEPAPAAREWDPEALEAAETQDTLETREPPPAPPPALRGRGQRRARPTAGLSAVDQVRKAEFPVVLRGYDRAAVDAYVAEVAQLVAELEATQLPETVVQRALDQVGEETSTILKRAHEAAEEIAARSRSQAAGRVQRAESEAETIRREAEEDVRRLEEDARSIWQERSRLLDELRRLADEVLTVADDAGDRISPPARPPAAAPVDDQEASGEELAGPIEVGPDEGPWTDEPADAPPEPSPDVEEDTAEHFPGPGAAPR